MNEFVEKLKVLPQEKREKILNEIKVNGKQYNIFPLSIEQRQMWVLYNIDKNSPYYSIPIYIEATGKIDLELVNKAIHKICIANSAFQSIIMSIDGQSFVHIDKNRFPQIKSVKVNNKNEALDMMEQEYKRPFDLEEEIPIRVVYFENNENECYLFLNVHHMFVDAFSGNIVFDEFISEYKKLAKGIDEKIETPKYQYSNYAIEQQDWDYKKEKDFWVGNLKDASFFTNLRHSYPSPLKYDRKAETISVTIDKEKITALCKEMKVSCYSYLLSIYYVLLSKVCGKNNITIGTPTLNRNKKTESVIGYFANTIPLNAKVEGNLSFDDFIGKINQNNIDCIDNAKLPFSNIVELNSAYRDDIENPIFQTLFTYHGKSINFKQKAKEGEIEFSFKDINDRMELQFDMICTAVEEDDCIDCNFTYKSSLFSAEMMKEFVNAFLKIYNITIADPKIKNQEICAELFFDNENYDLNDLKNDLLKENDSILDIDIFWFYNHFIIFYNSINDINRECFYNLISKKYTNDFILCNKNRFKNIISSECIKNKDISEKILKSIICKEELSARNAASNLNIYLTESTDDNIKVVLECNKGANFDYYKNVFGESINFVFFENKSNDNSLPLNDVEEKMLKIWEDVLEKKDLSLSESFFALGGTSFKCISLADKIDSTFEITFNIATLFKYSTIRELSAYISELLGTETTEEVLVDDNIEEI